MQSRLSSLIFPSYEWTSPINNNDGNGSDLKFVYEYIQTWLATFWDRLTNFLRICECYRQLQLSIGLKWYSYIIINCISNTLNTVRIKTPEEKNRNFTGFYMKREIEVEHASVHGLEIQRIYGKTSVSVPSENNGSNGLSNVQQ